MTPSKKYIPMKRKDSKGRKNLPWVTKEVKESIKLKAETYKLAKFIGRREEWERFRMQQR